MAGAAINPHSVRKYQNGKSGLLSGMVTLHPSVSFLEVTPQTTIQEFIDWRDLNRFAHQSIRKTMLEDKLIELCKKLVFHVESEKLEIASFKGVEGITITKQTSFLDMTNWIIQMPSYDPYESVLIEGIKNFIALKK